MLRLQKGLLALLSLVFATSAGAQGNAVILKGGRTSSTLSIQTSQDHLPSVYSKGGVIATGAAANIIAGQIAPQSQDATPVSMVAQTRLIPLMKASSAYAGSLTVLNQRVLIGSAHVLAAADETSLAALARTLNTTPDQLHLYQFKSSTRYLDAVVVTVGENAVLAQATLQNLRTRDSLRTGASFALKHLTEVDGHLIEQENSGRLSISTDRQTLYLPNGSDAFLTWGSSGAVVATPDSRIGTAVAGLVQCVVKIDQASSRASDEHVSYFRAISIDSLSQSELVPTSLDEVRGHSGDYGLEHCGPVGGKDGGGGG